MKFNRLTVIGFHKTTKDKRSLWECKCDCGNTTFVETYRLKSGHTKSCGCFAKEVWSDNIREIALIHGGSHSKEYSVWKDMKKRCNNKRNENYGGRGITVCDEWQSFENFYRDMGERPKGMSLDRKDNNGNYCKDNCRWATRSEQNNNRRNNVSITVGNITKTVAEWSKATGICESTIRYKMKAGYPMDDVLFTVEEPKEEP